MKRLIAILACLTVASPVSAAPKPLYNPAAVVKVTCQEGTGTAFRVADGRYITAAHVAKLSDCTIEDRPVVASVIDDETDVGIFVGPKGGPTIPFSCRDFVPNENYLSIGYAFGWDKVTIEPLIASPAESDDYRMFVGEIIPGMSGGPIIGYDGKVRGVNNMRWPARGMPLSHTFVCKD